MRRITLSIPWPLTGVQTRDILSFGFQIALVSYLSFFLIENIKPGFVTSYMDLNWWLWATILTGVLSAIWPYAKPVTQAVQTGASWYDFLFMGVLSIGTVAVVWYKTSSVGWMAMIIALLSGLLVLGLSLLVYYDHDDDDT